MPGVSPGEGGGGSVGVEEGWEVPEAMLGCWIPTQNSDM